MYYFELRSDNQAKKSLEWRSSFVSIQPFIGAVIAANDVQVKCAKNISYPIPLPSTPVSMLDKNNDIHDSDQHCIGERGILLSKRPIFAPTHVCCIHNLASFMKKFKSLNILFIRVFQYVSKEILINIFRCFKGPIYLHYLNIKYLYAILGDKKY